MPMHLFGHAGRNITRQTDLSSEWRQSDFGRSPVGCNQANQHVEAQGNHKYTHCATNNTLRTCTTCVKWFTTAAPSATVLHPTSVPHNSSLNNTLSATTKPSTNFLDSRKCFVVSLPIRSDSPSTCTGDTFLQFRHVFNPVQGAVLDGTGRSMSGDWDLWCIRRGTFSQAAPALV